MRTPLLLTCLAAARLGLAQLGPEHRFGYPMNENGTVAIHDMDADGDGDVVLRSGGRLWLYEQEAPGTFTVTADRGPVGDVQVFRSADVNGDGIDDLVYLDRSADKISYIPIIGGSPGAIVDLVTTPDLHDLRTGDIDGDGDHDLVASTSGTPASLRWWANDGTGYSGASITLVADIGLPLEDYNTFVLADLDDDVDLDLLTRIGTDEMYLALLRNDGGGSFTTTFLPSDLDVEEIVVADLDDDAYQDLVVTVPSADNTSIIGLLNDGAGGFSGDDQVPIHPATGFANQLNAMDADGDGDCDAIFRWAQTSGPTADRRILGARNEGGGSFTSHSFCHEFQSSYFWLTQALGSLDGDALVDVVGDLEDELAVGFNGDGAIIRLNGTHQPERVVAGQFLGDNRPDVLLMGAWDMSYHSSRPLRLSLHENVDDGAVRTQPSSGWRPSYYWSIYSPPGVADAHPSDLDGDGDLDLLALYGGSSSQWGRWMVMLNEDGSLDSTSSVGNSINGPWPDQFTPHLGDIDQDGDPDLITHTMYGIGTSLNNGDGSFAPPVVHSVPTYWNFSSLTSGDMDGDGALEYVWVVADSILQADFDGIGSPTTPMFSGIAPFVGTQFGDFPFRAIDLNADGMDDLVLMSEDAVAFMYSDGIGGFQSSAILPYDGQFDNRGPHNAFGDMDGNGYPDMLAMLNDGTVLYWSNSGTNINGPEIVIEGSAHSGRSDLDLADMDGDGDLDVLTCTSPPFAGPGQSAAAWLENTGDLPTTTDVAPPTRPLVLYPNPMRDEARLVLATPIGSDTRIELIDASGRMLRAQNGTGSREVLIGRGHLKSGMYVLRVMRGSGHIGSARIVIH
ncbi:MAG: T9SS type A sorting domain-containing protein [Flavobacteriales bacterium]|nr:T9SS type A sorting domain-containing protein [Flavobacteriales bacterium]